MSLAWAATGDTATWVGSLGTWFVGLVAGVIAWRQFQHGRFRPQVHAYRDDDGRIVVRLVNRGAGAGSVEDVDLLAARRPVSDVPLVAYRWEVAGTPAPGLGSSPFTLPGASTAQLVLLPEDATAITDKVHVRVHFGTGHRCAPRPLRRIRGRIYGSTSIPGETVPAPGGAADR